MTVTADKAPKTRAVTEVTADIARFVTGLRFEDIPASTVETARSAFLDCTGVALAGRDDEAAEIIVEMVRENGGKAEAGVIGSGFKVPAAQAALANGVMAHALDYDDMHSVAMCHTSAILVPTIYALAERLRFDGREAIAAYTIGFEIVYRLGRDFVLHSKAPSIHPTPKSGTIGAVCAAARLLRLEPSAVQTAIGIAGSLTSGLRSNVGTMTRPLHAGNSAHAGVMAALLAQKGFTADPRTFDTEWGYTRAFAPRDGSPESLAEGLGERFDWPERLEFKRYPSCGKGHSLVDSMLRLVTENDLLPDQVESIDCETSSAVPNVMMYHRPTTGLQGKFSLEYCMAVALIDRACGLKQFSDERAADPYLQQMLRRVKYIHPTVERDFSERGFLTPEKLTIHLKDGRSVSHQGEFRGFSFGGGEPPDLIQKYQDCASAVLSASEIQESLEKISNIDSQNDLTGLMRILCKTK